MKIAVLTHRFPAASETGIVDHVAGLLRHGHTVYILAIEVDDGLLQKQGFSGHPRLHLRHGALRVSSALLVRRSIAIIRNVIRTGLWGRLHDPMARGAVLLGVLAERHFREIEPDIVHAHFGNLGIAALVGRRTAKFPLVITFRGFDINILTKRHGWGTYRHLLVGAPNVHCVVHSDFMKNRIESSMPVVVQKIQMGIAIEKFADERTSWQPSGRLLSIGRLIPAKGHDTAIRVLAAAVAHYPEFDWRLELIGEGPMRNTLSDLAAELGVRHRVEFRGAVPYQLVAEALSRSDALLFLVRRDEQGNEEAFGRAAVEGLAAGLPVFGCAVGGVRETLAETGILVNDDEPELIAGKIVAEFQSPNWIEKVRRRRAEAKKYEIERMWNQYDGLYRSAVKELTFANVDSKERIP